MFGAEFQTLHQFSLSPTTGSRSRSPKLAHTNGLCCSTSDIPLSRLTSDIDLYGLLCCSASVWAMETSESSSIKGVHEKNPEKHYGFVCRICWDFGGKPNDPLISPCLCKGTQRYVHRSCLDSWLSQKKEFASSHCPTCRSQFYEPAQCDITFKLFVVKKLGIVLEALNLRTECGEVDARYERRILAHIYQKYRIDLDGTQQQKILESLGSQCGYPSYRAMHRWYSAIEQAYLFQGVSDDLILQLASKVKPRQCTQQFVMQNGPQSHFYIVARGELDLTTGNTDDEMKRVTVERGGMFNEVSTLWGLPQFFTAVPVNFSCELLRLDRGTFLELVQHRLSDVAVMMHNILKYIETPGNQLSKHRREIRNMLNCGETHLATLHFAAFEGNHSLMHLLLTKGLDPNDSDEKGRTPLHVAASKGRDKCARLLLDFGANPNIKDQEGNIPLWEAMMGSHELVTKLLIQYGAEISFGDVGTFAYIAAHRKNFILLEQIVQFGGDINLPSLVDSKITAAEEGQHKISTKESDFLNLLFKVVTFDYVTRADDDLFFGSAMLSVDDLPYSLLGQKKCLNRHETDSLALAQNFGSCSIGGYDKGKTSFKINPPPPPRVAMSCPRKGGICFMVLLPDNFQELLKIASKKFEILSDDIIIVLNNGARIDCLDVIRDGDHLIVV